jgi:hypothetical protein
MGDIQQTTLTWKSRNLGPIPFLQPAGFVGIFIPVQTHMRITEIVTARDLPVLFAPTLSRSGQNIPQVLRHKLR